MKAEALPVVLVLLWLAPVPAESQEKSTPPPAIDAPTKIEVVPAPAAGKGEPITKLPGLDLTVMTAAERQKLLDATNRVKCTCGCDDDSLAWCLNHHTDCTFALPLVSLMATEVSPGFKKMQKENDIANWLRFRTPTEDMKHNYNYLKGFDLDVLTAKQREIVLAKANALMCDCGCVGDSLARCVNIDPTCTVAPAKIKALIEEVKVSSPSR